MLWKACLTVNTEDLANNIKNGEKPYLRPIETSLGCQITIIGASGVPLPQVGTGNSAFHDEDIVKRAVRVCIEYT